MKHKTMLDDYGDEVTEARVLPMGGAGHIICGRNGYKKDIAFRMQENKRLTESARYDLPAWESLRVYFKDGEYL